MNDQQLNDNFTDDMITTVRPVSMSEVIKAARLVGWSERVKLFLYPWPTLSGNVVMWMLLGGISAISGMICLTAIRYSVSNIPFVAAVLFLSVFSIGTMYVSQVTDGLTQHLTDRLRVVQAAIREQLQASADAYGAQFAATLKNVTGKDINPNPISMAAAVLEATEKAEERKNNPTNPLRAILDGTLNPNDLLDEPPPHDDDSLYN